MGITFNLIIKLFIYFFVGIFVFVPITADVEPVHVLKKRLKQVNNFYVQFVQKIQTVNGDFEQISQGELWIKQPNLFHCHIYDPEESVLISDGQTIWFYIPILNQVTAYKLNTGIANNFFLKLLLNHTSKIWNTYRIQQKQDWFYLEPILSAINDITHEQYQIKIDHCGIISNFNIIEPGKKYTSFDLFNQNKKCIDTNKFKFNIPADIQLDDQR